MLRTRGFTLIEIVIAVSILLLIIFLAVPSLTGVMADKRLRRSLDGFTNVVQQAQQRSVSEHRPYLIIWDGKAMDLRPESLAKDEKLPPPPPAPFAKTDELQITFPAALTKEPPEEWIFWPTGTCEPAIVQFSGRDGTWTAKYSGLSAQPELMKYAAR